MKTPSSDSQEVAFIECTCRVTASQVGPYVFHVLLTTATSIFGDCIC